MSRLCVLLWALGVAVLLSGCCAGPCCRPGVRCLHRGGPCGPACCPGGDACGDEYIAEAAEYCPPVRRPLRKGRVAAAIHPLKSHGRALPTVDMPPLPRFHPVPTRPVFEPQVVAWGAGG